MATDIETNKATVRQFFGAVERRDFKAFDQIVVEDYVHNIEGMPIGREGLKRHFTALFGAIPDLTMPILDLISEGDTVMVRNRVRGTHEGDFGPLKATAKTFDIAAFHLYRLMGGPIGRALRGGGYGGTACASAQLKPMVVHIRFCTGAVRTERGSRPAAIAKEGESKATEHSERFGGIRPILRSYRRRPSESPPRSPA
jgi:predicted ester cyclase